MLDRLEDLQRRWLALFGLNVGLAVIVGIIVRELFAEPETPGRRTIPEGLEAA